MPSTSSAPTGMQLSGTAPKPVRVSKRAMMALGFVVTLLAIIICYGAYKRSQDPNKATVAQKDETKPQSALPAGRRLKEEAAAKPDPLAGTQTGTLTPNPKTSGADTTTLTPPPLEKTPKLDGVSPFPASSANVQTSGNVNRDLTPEEKRRQLAYLRDLEARNAPTTVQIANTSVPGAAAAGRGVSTSPVSDLLGALTGRQSSNPKTLQDAVTAALRPQGSQPDSTSDSAATEKEQFLEKARARRPDNYLNATRLAQLSKYEIKAGWDIPAVLEQALDSDLPGEIRSMVRSDVYDSATGRYLLIPQGAHLVGTYNANVQYGQSALQAVWSRIIFPDGSSINLDGMIGQDNQGKSGFRYDVDHHYKRLFGTALLTSLFSAGLQLSQNTGQQSVNVTPTPGQVAGQAVGQQVTQLGIEITRKNLQVAPTIKIPMGYRFNVRVNRDMLLDRPYIRETNQDSTFQTAAQQ